MLHTGAGFESGAEIKPNIPPHTHFTTFEALCRHDTIKDKAHITVFLQSDTTAPVFFFFFFFLLSVLVWLLFEGDIISLGSW